MDTLLACWAVTTFILFLLFEDPNVPEFIKLRLLQVTTNLRGAGLRLRLLAQLSVTRRSFRDDWIGRRLRDFELRSIQRNPAYRELFKPRPEPLQEGED